jgi:pSer/pThr/pTyr-binding forkhead associated (FHA) protein
LRDARTASMIDGVRIAVRRAGRPFTPPRLRPGEHLVLGRASACDLSLTDATVSRRHAELRREADGWLLVDCASMNGTWVNGVRIERAPVRDGDQIRLGRACLVLEDR